MTFLNASPGMNMVFFYIKFRWSLISVQLAISQQLLTHWGRSMHICVGKLPLIQVMACRLDDTKPLSKQCLGTNFSEIIRAIEIFSLKKVTNYVRPNRRVSQMRAFLAACHELAVDHNTLPEVLYVSEHKTWYILIHAPYTRIVVLCHINHIRPMISYSQFCNNNSPFCTTAIFVKYCYTTDSL